MTKITEMSKNRFTTPDYFTKVSLKQYLDAEPVIIHGVNPDLDSSGFETVWTLGGVYVFPDNAEVLDVSSDNILDDFGNTGATAILLTGLDENYDVINEVVIMDGTNVKTTTKEFLRMNRAIVATAGSTKTNQGNITIQNQTGDVLAYIDAGSSWARQSVYTVAQGKRVVFLGTNYSACCSQLADVNFEISVSVPTGVTYKSIELSIATEVSTYEVKEHFIKPVFSQRTDLQIMAESDKLNTYTSSSSYLIEYDGLKFNEPNMPV